MLNEKNKNKELINEKNEKINKLKNELEKVPFKLEEGENLISVIVNSTDHRILYSSVCKNTDKFYVVVNKFYELYPEYIERNFYFTSNGNIVDEYATLKQNKIKDNDIILLNFIDD